MKTLIKLIEVVCCAVVLSHLYTLSLMPDPLDGVKAFKAEQDCDALRQAIQKYAECESDVVKSEDMRELEGKYITNIKTLRDPWGNAYGHDRSNGEVYSKGPDGKRSTVPDSSENKDNIVAFYSAAPVIADARLEVNPMAGNFMGEGAEEKERCFDRLHLYFNAEMELPRCPVDLSSASDIPAVSALNDNEAASGKLFRYFVKSGQEIVPAECPVDLKAACGKGSDVSLGPDSKEIIIKFAPGYTSADPSKNLLVPGRHYINITGAENNKNKCFTGRSFFKKIIEGAEAAKRPLLIKKYE